MATPSRDFQNARFFLLVDGIPYFFGEESAPVYLHARGKGDLTTGKFGLKINGEQIFLRGTGFTDNTFRDLGAFDVSHLLHNQTSFTLEGFADGVAPDALYVNHMEIHFVHPFGEPITMASASPAQHYDFVQLQDLVSPNSPQIKSAKPRSTCESLTKRGLSMGNAQIDLQTYAQTGFSLQARLNDPSTMLADIFTTRKEPYAFATTDILAISDVFSAGDINKTHSAADVGKVFYAGSEAIFVDFFAPASTSISVLRGCYGTSPEKITGNETAGQNIYLAIPGFTGRRAQLWVGYKAPTPHLWTSSDPPFVSGSQLPLQMMGWEDFEQIGTFRVEDAPESLGMGAFNLQLSDLSTFFANRKTMVNCRAVEARSAATFSTDNMKMLIEQPDGEKLKKGSANTLALVKSKAIFRDGDERSETDLVGVFPYTYSASEIEIFLPDHLALFDWSSNPDEIQISEAKQIFPIVGDPISGVLTIINSADGTLTIGSYDTLPGNPEPEGFYEESYRMGAAINDNDIDVSSFTRLAGLSLPWSFFLTDEWEVRDILRWLCISTRCCWFVSPAGKLTMKTFDLVTRLTESDAIVSINQSDILRKTEDKGQASEKNVASSFRIKTNYSTEGDPTLTVNFTDLQTLKKYPTADNVTTYELPFLQTANTTQRRDLNRYSTLAPVSLNDLELVIRRKMKMNEKGIFTTEVVLPWKYAGIGLGDKIRLTNPDLFNYETPTQSSLGLFFVTGKKMALNEGTITLTLVAIKSGRSLCQAGEIASYNAGTQTITFNPLSGEWNPEVPSGGEPSSFFAPGMKIRVYDESASGMFDEVVDAIIDPNSISLQGTPSATYVAGDVVMIEEYGDNANGPTLFSDPEALGVFAADRGIYTGEIDGTRMN